MENESVLEKEIAELSRVIEAKRSALAAERGVVPEREVIQAAVKELSPALAVKTDQAPILANAAAAIEPSDDYLDSLDEESIAKVNDLVASIGEHGFKKAIARAKEEIPYVLDVFHDALVTRLYDELKSRGLVG